MNWEPLLLTAKLAAVTTLLLFTIGIPLASWIAFSRTRIMPVVETLVSMPLVLPPTVIGFYLLLAFAPSGIPGKFLHEWFDLNLVFSFPGLVIASMIYSLPFMVHPIQSALKNLPVAYREASYSLGKSRFTTLIRVLLPNIRPALLTGIVLSFAHTVGEFGVVLMIGGSIPGKTRVASIAIYDEVEAMNYASANAYSLVLFVLAFVILLTLHLVNGNHNKTLFKW